MRSIAVATVVILVSTLMALAATSGHNEEIHPDILLFFQAASSDAKVAKAALREIETHWRDGYTPMFIDLARLLRPSARTGVPGVGVEPVSSPVKHLDVQANLLTARTPVEGLRDPGSPIRRRLLQFLKKRTGQKFGDDLDGWRRWMWSLPYEPHPEYAFFKAGVYRNIDPRMTEFLYPDRPAEIRLDEIDWGGVRVNGVPPLDHPTTIPATDAGWLDDDHVVFGIEINGELRAYPKRIVSWHEIVRDTVGGVDIVLVYCTLCGSVIPYESRLGDEQLTFGTSGLVYRSNKLMFDEETMTLWSSLYGKPVVGPRVGSGQRLKRFPVVTTTWGEWKDMHPRTSVTSIDTGFDKDYAEGAAYSDYTGTDRIWFEVPVIDKRLKNKDEVVTLELGGKALAVSRKFLRRHGVYHHTLDGEQLVYLTSHEGTTRVYAAGTLRFERWGDGMVVYDRDGARWRVEEDALVAEDGTRFPRVATSPSYWFGWYAQYPETELVQ